MLSSLLRLIFFAIEFGFCIRFILCIFITIASAFIDLEATSLGKERAAIVAVLNQLFNRKHKLLQITNAIDALAKQRKAIEARISCSVKRKLTEADLRLQIKPVHPAVVQKSLTCMLLKNRASMP